MAATTETCASCNAYREPSTRSEAERDRMLRAGVNPDRGFCRLNPAQVEKMPDEWCRQFERRAAPAKS